MQTTDYERGILLLEAVCSSEIDLHNLNTIFIKGALYYTTTDPIQNITEHN